MLKDRGQPVGPRRCGLKYAPIGWDCDAANTVWPPSVTVPDYLPLGSFSPCWQECSQLSDLYLPEPIGIVVCKAIESQGH